MKAVEILAQLESLAANQWGIITTAQAQREGISRLHINRLAGSEILTRARRGIYFLPSVQLGPLTDVREAWISLEPNLFAVECIDADNKTVVSHESAALIHSIGDLIPNTQTFSASLRKQTSQNDIHIYDDREMGVGDIESIDGLPVTSVEKTVEDLASQIMEFDYLATLVVDSLRKEGVRLKSLAKRLDPVSAAYGFNSGNDLLAACWEEAGADEDNEELRDRFFISAGTGVETRSFRDSR